MLSLNDILKSIDNIIDDLDKFSISKLAVFGSFVRGEQNEKSDIDILVEFKDNHETFDNYMDLKFYLEDLFDKNVDLVIFSSLKSTMKASIMRSIVYAKGA